MSDSSTHNTPATPSPSLSLQQPASPGSSPPSPASWATLAIAGAVSCYGIYRLTDPLLQLIREKQWSLVAAALLCTAIVAAPASAIPLLRSLLERFLPGGSGGGK